MKSNKALSSVFLLITAFIWGTTFVAQSSASEKIPTFTFNSMRSFIGAGVLFFSLFFLDRFHLTQKPETPKQKKDLLTGGICCGIILCFAANLQQFGIEMGTSAGKAGFLSAFYIIMVPFAGVFIKKTKINKNVWVGVALAFAGLYFLCIKEKIVFQVADVFVLLSALAYSFHILAIEYFSPFVCGVRMSLIQFIVLGIVSGVLSLFFEPGSMREALKMTDMYASVLFSGVFSSGIAYTLQIIGQRGADSVTSSLLMSTESIFSVLAGGIILGEYLTDREIAGCILVFIAIILAQLPEKH